MTYTSSITLAARMPMPNRNVHGHGHHRAPQRAK
jgi:hypothetical protein